MSEYHTYVTDFKYTDKMKPTIENLNIFCHCEIAEVAAWFRNA
jgi:hypothetical protein